MALRHEKKRARNFTLPSAPAISKRAAGTQRPFVPAGQTAAQINPAYFWDEPPEVELELPGELLLLGELLLSLELLDPPGVSAPPVAVLLLPDRPKYEKML